MQARENRVIEPRFAREKRAVLSQVSLLKPVVLVVVQQSRRLLNFFRPNTKMVEIERGL